MPSIRKFSARRSSMRFLLITNDVDFAKAAHIAGVERFMVDLELHGKQERQGHKDTFITSHHSGDIARMRDAVPDAELMVRINPLHGDSHKEIDLAIGAGADLIMLPMFTRADELKQIAELIAHRARFVPLFEHYKALEAMEECIALGVMDECYLGLNDLHISLDQRFLFEPLLSDYVEQFAAKAARANLPFGFGGLGSLRADVAIPPKLLFAEHARLGSRRVILSRAFQNVVAREDLAQEIALLREAWALYQQRDNAAVSRDHDALIAAIQSVLKEA